MLGPLIALGIVAIASFVPGWLALHALPERLRRHLGGEHLLPLSFAFSFILLALVHLATFLAGSPRGTTNLAVAGLVVIGLAVRLAITRTRPSFGESQWLPVLGLLLLLLLLVLALTPSHGTAFFHDYLLYYPNTDVLLGHASVVERASGTGLEYFAKRTPLLSLYGSFFLSFLGQGYANFQIAGLVANALVFWPVSLLARRLLGPRARVFALLLLAISPAMAHATATAEPKIAGVGLVLLAFHLHLLARRDEASERRNVRSAVAGLLAVAAVATHPSMLLYAGWIFVDQAVLRFRRRADSRPALWAGAVIATLVLLMPWMTWLAASLGPRAAFAPSTTIAASAEYSAGRYLSTRLGMLLTTALVPRQLIVAWRAPAPDPSDAAAVGTRDGYTESARLRYYQDTYLGGLTTAVGVVMLCLGVQRRPRDAVATRSLPFLWALLGALGCFAVHLSYPEYSGNALTLTSPLFVLFLVYAGHVVATLSPLVRAIVLATALLESAYVRVSTFTFTSPWPPDFDGSVGQRVTAQISGTGLAALAVSIGVVAAAYAIAIVRAQRVSAEAEPSP